MTPIPSHLTVAQLGRLTGHRDSLYALSPLHQPSLVATAGGDGMVVVWDALAPDEGKPLARMAGTVYSLLYDEASSQLCVGQNQDGLYWLQLNNAEAGLPTAAAAGSLHLGSADIYALAQPRPGQLVAGLSTGEAVSIDATSRRIIARANHATPKPGQQRSLRTLAVLEGGLLAAGYSDGWVRLLSPDSLGVVEAWQASDMAIFSLTLLPATLSIPARLLAAGRDARLRTFDPLTGRLLQEVAAHNYAIHHAALSPDEALLATCSLDKSIKIWDAETLTLIKVIDKARHAGHGTSVNRLLWLDTPTAGPILVSCSDDRTATLWSLSVPA